ncbi:MAG TPA: type II toxin-antitoxin system RelE/ParE family toxin [Acidobacteriaceae bacterium]|nr:type II toxin-antitoxin system RelE/ParE family toxin [Acidobacteriaceae bacterium]
MIRSFKHSGLEKFFRTGSKAGIQPGHERKLRLLLTALDAASDPLEMNGAGWNFHALSGKWKGHWAVSINGNWRLTFTFRGEDAEVVNYVDYH